MPSKKKLKKAIRREVIDLWYDLDRAQQYSRAPQGRESAGEEVLEERLMLLVQLVGLTPWRKVPCTLLLNGTYERLARWSGYDGTIPADAHATCRHPEGHGA